MAQDVIRGEYARNEAQSAPRYIYIFINYESYVDVSCLLLQLTVKKPGLSEGSDI